MEKMDVLSPVGGEINKAVNIAPRLDNLDGITIGEVWNGVFKGDYTFPVIRELLKAKYPKVKIIPYTEFPYFHGADDPAKQKELAKKIAEFAKKSGCDAVISGNGACGNCTPAATRPAAEAEKLGIPTVVIAASGFSLLGKMTGKAAGVEDLRMAEYPGALGIHHQSQIDENIKTVLFKNIVDGLTKPVDRTESKATTGNWNPEETIYSGTIEQVNRFFAQKGWSDGLPIIPPTTERVNAFLKYTMGPPSKEVAALRPSNLMAVHWNIAVNAVMAGCEPCHMPIIVAAVEALGDPRFNLDNVRSTSGLLPFLVINGPVIQQIGIEYGGQLISKGPNPAIGRAVGLIVRNIAGVAPGKNYMGTFGYPLVFTLAENEQESPWESFHVEQGFDKGASTVTLGMTNNWGPQPSAASTPDKNGAQSALEGLSREILKKVRLYAYPGSGPQAEIVMITLLLSPVIAKSLASSGYSKKDVKNYLFENTKIPLGEFEWITKYTTGKGEGTVREKARIGIFPKEYLGKAEDRVKLLSSPDILHIVVCGDPNRNRMMTLEGGHARPTTKEIKLPSNWDGLLRNRNREF